MAKTLRGKSAPQAKPTQYCCPLCGAISHNPHDIEQHYCGACRQFADDVVELLEHTILLAIKRGVTMIAIPVALAKVTVATIRKSMAAN